MRTAIIFAILFFLVPDIGRGQKAYQYDTARTMDRKNVVRWNMTPWILWGGGNFTLGYERRISEFQSVSLNVGRLEFPELVSLNLSSLNVGTQKDRGGFSIAADYRRYFKTRNRGLAPDGLYWGPYIAYYTMGLQNSWIYTDSNTFDQSNLTLDGRINILNVGVELGYQFVIKRRLTVDLIFIGPGVGFYSGKFELDGNLNIDEEDELIQALRDALYENYPGLETLVSEKTLETSGSFGNWGAGLRFVVQIGFAF